MYPTSSLEGLTERAASVVLLDRLHREFSQKRINLCALLIRETHRTGFSMLLF